MNLRLACLSVLAILLVRPEVTNGLSCKTCKGYDDCDAPADTPCDTFKWSTIEFADPEKAKWEIIKGLDTEWKLDEGATLTACVTVQWKGENAEIRGCVPKDTAAPAEFCAALAAKDGNATCKACVDDNCNKEPSLKSSAGSTVPGGVMDESTTEPPKAASGAINISFDLTLCYWVVAAVLLKLIL